MRKGTWRFVSTVSGLRLRPTGPALISFFRALGRAAVCPGRSSRSGDAGKRLVHAFRTFLYGIPIICGGNVRFSSVRSGALSRVLAAGRPSLGAAVATETTGKASLSYGSAQHLARFCSVRTGRFCGSDGFAGGRRGGRNGSDRIFVPRADNLHAAQSLYFKSQSAMKKILLMVALASLCASVSAQKSADRKAARAAQKEYTGHWMPACTIRP